MAAESSTGTWTTVWTDLLTDLDYYKGRAYRIEPVPGDSNAFYAFIAYPLDLFEEGSVVNVLTSLVGNVFGFKAVRSLRLEDIRFPLAYVKTCGGPPNGIQMERDRLNKYGRPLLGCTIKPKLGLSAKNYGRAVYECLRGGLDFTKDDENINSQPFMRWQHRFEFVMEAVPQGRSGDRRAQGALPQLSRRRRRRRCTSAPSSPSSSARRSSCTTSSPRASPRTPGSPTGAARTACCCTSTARCTRCSTATRYHGIHFRVLTKCLRLSGGDHLHSGTVVGKLEGDREATLGWVDLMREPFVPENRARGIFFDQDWGAMPGVMPVASGGIHVWHMPALLRSSATTPASSSAAAPSAIRGATRPARTPTAWRWRPASRPATRAARSSAKAARFSTEAAQHSPELKIAMETWKEIKFEFDMVDKLDAARSAPEAGRLTPENNPEIAE